MKLGGLLKGIGLGTAGVFGAPFTGGGSLALLGPALGKIAEARGKTQAANEQLGTTSATDQNAAQLDRDKFAATAPNTRLQSAIRASLASNFQPSQTKWAGPGSGVRGEIPTTTGGFAGGMANLDPRAKDLASTVMNDQLMAQQKGGMSGGGADSRIVPYPKIGQSSTGSKILGAAGTGMSLLSLISQFLKPQQSNSVPIYGGEGEEN